MKRITAALTATVAAALLMAGCGTNTDLFGSQDSVVEPASAGSTTTPTPSAACEPQYVQVKGNNEGNRVIGDFAARYAAATAEANNLAEAQRKLLLEESAKNAQVLATWAYGFGLHEDPDNWKPLVADNCLSPEGMRLHAMLTGILTANGTEFEEANAPANGFNSGVHDGTFGVANVAGITGDRKAIKVTLPDGTVVYIMVRCGNLVFPSKPNLPEVPTDNPPPPERPKPPPTKEGCPAELPMGTPPNCKDAPSNDPYPNGNAPTGGGRNADPGPGTYIPPSEMEQPPDAPRVNPPAPEPQPPAPRPTTPSDPNPAPVPTRDPAPAPEPEPEAPEPEAPETGCVPIPGVEDCS